MNPTRENWIVEKDFFLFGKSTIGDEHKLRCSLSKVTFCVFVLLGVFNPFKTCFSLRKGKVKSSVRSDCSTLKLLWLAENSAKRSQHRTTAALTTTDVSS